ncbi:hypothetical protein FCM35_KLT06887 [Carex littledalei]|uniref:Uncharacterized protein n=1 Tax=Carex littledalei TaxID=544730 RepID=A0A833R1K6_9POAL|nr:hypothetical protein FCM35_KLT06887 [Carex littledalei]
MSKTSSCMGLRNSPSLQLEFAINLCQPPPACQDGTSVKFGMEGDDSLPSSSRFPFFLNLRPDQIDDVAVQHLLRRYQIKDSIFQLFLVKCLCEIDIYLEVPYSTSKSMIKVAMVSVLTVFCWVKLDSFEKSLDSIKGYNFKIA